MRKTAKQLQLLDDDSTDIWKDNWFDKYSKRPIDLNEVTLAQYVSKYYINKKKKHMQRKTPRVIRYRNYDTSDLNEYKREMVTLYIPFRNDNDDILADAKYISIYDQYEDVILHRRREFESDLDI